MTTERERHARAQALDCRQHGYHVYPLAGDRCVMCGERKYPKESPRNS